MFRETLRVVLDSTSEFQVVGDGSATVGTELKIIDQSSDIVLLDLEGGREESLRLLVRLRTIASALPVVLLQTAPNRLDIVEWLRLGARGVIDKRVPLGLLFRCVRRVAAGEFWVPREVVADLVAALPARSTDVAPVLDPVTPREREILLMVADGCTNREIARRCSICEGTVKHHLTSLFAKFSVTSRLELALVAVRHGVAGAA